MTDSAAPRLFRHATDVEVFSPGQVVFHDGDQGDAMYGIKEGTLEVLVHDQVVDTVGPGGFVGEMALLEHAPRSATVVAKTDCQLVKIDEKRFLFMVQQTPFFALEMLRVLARRLRATNERV